MNPTTEQLAITEASKGTSNLMIQALAGTGKTSTLEMVAAQSKLKPLLYLVFNKRNADEAEKRLSSEVTVRTFNSLGHRIWADFRSRRLKVNARKTNDILKSIIDEVKDKTAKNELWDVFYDIVNAVQRAKALGYVPPDKFPTSLKPITRADFHKSLEEDPDDLVSDLIDAVLTKSIVRSFEGEIDFNDQIYMPALFGGRYPQFPRTLVDEYQDLNPVNHILLNKCVGTRNLIGVGDMYQNIYAFRGARARGMQEACVAYKMDTLPLSISFRCPSEIVKHVHWRVPEFKWTKEGGSVEVLESLEASDIPADAAIICRNNAPLLSAALRLLGKGRSISLAGSDIGPKLLAILKKLGPESLGRDAVLAEITEWYERKKEKNSSTAADMAECLRVFANTGNDLGQAIRYAEHLFAQEGTIRLMTGHKSKGLEFQTVYHLSPYLCRDDEQDQNLRYVISTRSMNRLFEVDLEAIAW